MTFDFLAITSLELFLLIECYYKQWDLNINLKPCLQFTHL